LARRPLAARTNHNLRTYLFPTECSGAGRPRARRCCSSRTAFGHAGGRCGWRVTQLTISTQRISPSLVGRLAPEQPGNRRPRPTSALASGPCGSRQERALILRTSERLSTPRSGALAAVFIMWPQTNKDHPGGVEPHRHPCVPWSPGILNTWGSRPQLMPGMTRGAGSVLARRRNMNASPVPLDQLGRAAGP